MSNDAEKQGKPTINHEKKGNQPEKNTNNTATQSLEKLSNAVTETIDERNNHIAEAIIYFYEKLYENRLLCKKLNKTIIPAQEPFSPNDQFKTFPQVEMKEKTIGKERVLVPAEPVVASVCWGEIPSFNNEEKRYVTLEIYGDKKTVEIYVEG